MKLAKPAKTNKQNPEVSPLLGKALINSTKSFVGIMPMMIAVIALVAIFQTYVTPKVISSFFGYSNVSDIFIGAFMGAIANGQGSISFIIAEGLKEQNVSLYALSTFTLAWVSLGFVQLPAEIGVFGLKFTIIRNILAFLSTISIAYLTIFTIGLFV